MCPEPEIAAVVFTDMDVAQPVAAVAHRRDEVVLLDVHVVRVEVDDDVVGTDVVGQPQAVARGVDHVGLVSVADLEPERDTQAVRLPRQGHEAPRRRWPDPPVVSACGALPNAL